MNHMELEELAVMVRSILGLAALVFVLYHMPRKSK